MSATCTSSSSVAIGALGDQYPDLIRDAPNIHTVLDAEEGAFLGTLRTGTAMFEAAVSEVERRGERSISGSQAFRCTIPTASRST